MGGCGFCTGFGTTLRGGIRKNLPVVTRVGRPREHERDLCHRLLPHGALLRGVDAEALELHARRGLAGAELDAAAETRSSIAMRSATRAGWL